MKVLTHNMMACTKKQCMGKGFPLKVESTEHIVLQQEFNYEFTKNIYPKLDWTGIAEISKKFNIPIELDTSKHSLEDEEFLKALHSLLCNLKVITGSLTCPNCQRVYPIDKSIPNMLLREDEIYQDIKEDN